MCRKWMGRGEEQGSVVVAAAAARDASEGKAKVLLGLFFSLASLPWADETRLD